MLTFIILLDEHLEKKLSSSYRALPYINYELARVTALSITSYISLALGVILIHYIPTLRARADAYKSASLINGIISYSIDGVYY